MPKQFYKITQFHGGLNSNSDARDIAENELSEATDVMVDELGKIRMMGGEATHGSTSLSPRANQINPGYGLFQFSHDRIDGHTAGSGVTTGADYLVLSEPDTAGTVDIYSDQDNTWGSPLTGMTNNTGGLRKDVFYTVDGALRVSDAEFGNTNTPKWYGYVHRSHFSIDRDTPPAELGTITEYSTWISSDQQMSAPTRGLLGRDVSDATGQQVAGVTTGGTSATALVDANAFTTFTDAADFVNNDYIAGNGNHSQYATITERTDANTLTTSSITNDWDSGDNWQIYPPVGTGFTLRFHWDPATTAEDWGDADVYEVAASFVYDGNQETELYYYNHTVTSVADRKLELTAHAIGDFNARYTGFNIYYRKEGNEDLTWLFLVEISLSNGMRLREGSPYSGWLGYSYGGSAGTLKTHSTSLNVHSPPTLLTYDIKSGSSLDNKLTSVKYKTAVISNRRAYIGNVQYTDFNSIVHTKGDAVIKSTVNQFDTFGLNGLLEASVNDGDSIVKLEAYADRLLIFKKNKLELLNISQEIEFLEDTFAHKGVSHPAATCKTDFGIAWVNDKGCYLYDGQKVDNLLEKKGRQIIKESDWATFTTNEPMIGYIPKKRQLLVVDDNSTTGTGKTFLYDMVTQSWVKGAAATITSQALTNFVTDWNGDLVHAHTSDTGTVVKWSDAAESSTCVDIKTKDIDFGQPAQTKRIYKFYVTHRGSASNIQLSYAINGDQDTYEEGGMSELPVTSAVTDWVTTTLTPSTAPFSCTSLRLRLFSDGTTPANFEINDITIVFRVKGQR